MWGDWQYGYMSLAQYEVKHNLFAKAMRKVDPSIILIADGAMPDTMTGSKQSLKLGDKLIPDYLGPADWTGNMFLHCLDNMDMISEHYYNYNTHFDLAKAAQVPNDPNEPLVDWMRRPANHIRIKYEEYQEYLKRIPALKNKPVPIALDEYAYAGGGGSYKVVPAYAWNFHEMFRHSDLYQLATLTFVTGTYSAARGQAVLNPVGMLFKFYRDRFGTIPVETRATRRSPNPRIPRRRTARRPRRQRHLPAGRGRGLDGRSQGPHRRRHQPDRIPADPEPPNPRRRALRQRHPPPHGPAEPHCHRGRRPGAGRQDRRTAVDAGSHEPDVRSLQREHLRIPGKITHTSFLTWSRL